MLLKPNIFSLFFSGGFFKLILIILVKFLLTEYIGCVSLPIKDCLQNLKIYSSCFKFNTIFRFFGRKAELARLPLKLPKLSKSNQN